MKTITHFQAFDGQQFDDEAECRAYEAARPELALVGLSQAGIVVSNGGTLLTTAGITSGRTVAMTGAGSIDGLGTTALTAQTIRSAVAPMASRKKAT